MPDFLKKIMPRKLKLSIIIVNYHSKNLLLGCLRSIFWQENKFSFEVIVVDNDEQKTIEKPLKRQFPCVKYIRSPGNIGFGAGNNLGTEFSRGEFLFFLNPDTIVLPGAINKLVAFMETRTKKKVGIVAPVLLDENKKPYPLQGTAELSPLTAVVSFSFLNKYFPNNPVSYHYWLKNWDKTTTKEVVTVPGTALLIRRKIFEKISGFDQKFFLYFEEIDLCKRVKESSWGIFINPSAKVIHLWGKCTPGSSEIKEIFKKSRFYYFRKHFGITSASLVELFLRSAEWLAQLF